MPTHPTDPSPADRKRADVRRNEQALLDAAAAVFVRAGVHAPVREIAAESGLGMGTIYRHFPTRADLVVAVFKHQVDALATTPTAPATDPPYQALRTWVHRFADFLVTKHGLAEAMRSDQAGFETLHNEFVERLLPVLDRLLTASAAAGSTRPDVRAYDLMLAIGNLCIGVEAFPDYHARQMIDLLLAGLTRTDPTTQEHEEHEEH
ncbi:TetR/AcrR family transcriptional regulator [Streptomyces malaysiensis subsp. malaysiensis]|uniref:TetR/AcrR family transcriptional regulator n=1 Tax=Streptomyces malaysiensis TaxID=92644 RepID=A0ABX6WL71_STRMQ|nr:MULTISPECIES: TetR/AcrR family transcriptional regulator [Streptomyces]QPI61355.1 TetR/AcrR family transcriptional regulator [Streptomyces solisilvae]UHH23128.1 TetR/AcrR family transcriptional regulator [Streptomyces sp. HNM0561]